MKALSELTEREILALAISTEEEDARIYRAFSDKVRADFPASSDVFDAMATTEESHHGMLSALYREKFGEHLPPIRREDVKGFLRRRPLWWTTNLSVDAIRREMEVMELQAQRFYEKAAETAKDPAIKALYQRLVAAEREHENLVTTLEAKHLTEPVREEEDRTKRRLFVLQYIQPGLAGLIDGSVSTLAPVFAAAFATQNNKETFLVGLAASIGAGISMGFTEALSDDGSITGRGSPVLRGVVCGLMTALGGLGHTLPYLVPDSVPNAFYIATFIAAIVVAIELLVISWIRTRYMDTPFLQAAFQVIVGGVLVLLAGILIGNA